MERIKESQRSENDRINRLPTTTHNFRYELCVVTAQYYICNNNENHAKYDNIIWIFALNLQKVK